MKKNFLKRNLVSLAIMCLVAFGVFLAASCNSYAEGSTSPAKSMMWSITEQTSTSAKFLGELESLGGYAGASFNAFVYSTSPDVANASDRKACIANGTAGVRQYTCNVTGLAPNTTYYVIARSILNGGSPSYVDSNNVMSFTTGPTLTGEVINGPNKLVSLKWNSTKGYVLYRNNIAYANVSGTSYTDPNVIPGNTYSYVVWVGASCSNTVTVTIPTTPPAPVITKIERINDTQAQVTWNRISGITVYNVETSTDNFATVGFQSDLTRNADTPSYTANITLNIGSGGTLSVRIKAKSGSTYGPVSNVVSIEAKPSSPAKPTGLTATVKNNSYVELRWTFIPGLSYQIYKNGSYLTTSINSAGLDDNVVTPGQSYSYYIIAVDSFGQKSSSSDPAVAVIPNAAEPAAPTNLKGIADDSNRIALSWTASAGAAGYYVYRNSVKITDTEKTGYCDTGLNPATIYLYYVKAYNSSGISSKSTTIMATTSVPPLVTTSAVTDISSTSATLNGDLTSMSCFTNIEMYGFVWSKEPYAEINGNGDRKLFQNKTAAGPFTYTLTGLTPNTKYYVNTCVHDNQGRYPDQYGTEISFTTISAASTDTTGPTIGVSPSSGTVSSGATITVTAIDTSGINQIAAQWDSDSSTTVLVNGSSLTIKAPAKAGTHVLTVQAMDNSSNYNPSEAKYSYTVSEIIEDTTDPYVITSTPSSNAKEIALNSKIRLDFNEDIGMGPNYTSITLSGTDAKLNGTGINGNWIIISTITPNNKTTYTLTLPTGAFKDAAGNLSKAYSLSFTTVTTVPVTGVTLNKSSTSLTVAGTETLTAVVSPSNATNQNVTWSSDNALAATVANGLVSAKAPGTAIITATTADGNKTASCTVTVSNAVVPVTSVSLNKQSTSMLVNGTEQLYATIAPTNATNQNVTWSSNAPSVAAIDAAGKITAISVGTAVITVTTVDGNKTAVMTVTVLSSTAVNFSDVKQNYWAYKAITDMAGSSVLSGYPDGTFKPESAVTRNEFAVIMTRALQMPLVDPEQPSFIDIPKQHWAYKYAETAKNYLTGYNTSSGIKFKGDTNALREDVTVALVKAKGYDSDAVDISELDKIFRDSSSISPSLKKYILIAVKRGLISGYPDGTFKPQGILTRAEASYLLWQLVFQSDEKIVL